MSDSCVCPPNDCPKLVRDCSAGNEDAWSELVKLHTARIQAIVRRRLGYDRRAEWEDCTQEILLQISRQLKTCRRPDILCHWVGVVAYRMAVNFVEQPNRIHEPIKFEPAAPPAPNNDRMECIEKAAENLPRPLPQVYDLKLQEMTNEQIAKQLGISVSTVYSHLREMRRLLKHCLED
jgi:RNA polymerase sigma factor (sigma-70 family)